VPLTVGGCVKVGTNSTSTSGRVLARGTSGQVFENTFRVRLRRGNGQVVAAKTLTNPPGPWSAVLNHSVPTNQTGLIEAFVLSAKDGALQCLSQRPLTLMP
jgi:hypothetical protein